jgi:hypothetical protein
MMLEDLVDFGEGVGGLQRPFQIWTDSGKRRSRLEVRDPES